jgi:hypothetical protein
VKCAAKSCKTAISSGAFYTDVVEKVFGVKTDSGMILNLGSLLFTNLLTTDYQPVT